MIPRTGHDTIKRLINTLYDIIKENPEVTASAYARYLVMDIHAVGKDPTRTITITFTDDAYEIRIEYYRMVPADTITYDIYNTVKLITKFD